jgi:hypothetical protein
MTKTFHRKKSSLKRRARQGELRNLTTTAREKLHSWFREQQGEIPYREIQRRLRDEFDIRVGFSSLSKYYNDKAKEIEAGPEDDRQVATKQIVIRIEVPAECAVKISTEEPR